MKKYNTVMRYDPEEKKEKKKKRERERKKKTKTTTTEKRKTERKKERLLAEIKQCHKNGVFILLNLALM